MNEANKPINADDLRNKRDNFVVAWDNFLKHVKKFPNDLYCFFEGKDDKNYYELRIMQYTQDYKLIICKNKVNVIRIYMHLKNDEKYINYKKAFFIDRDFDTPNTEKDIFETPCYSIENLYVSNRVFNKILKHTLDIDEKFDKYSQLFQQKQQEFHEATLEINALQACYTQEYYKNKAIKVICFKKISNEIEKIINFDNNIKTYCIKNITHSVAKHILQAKKQEFFQALDKYLLFSGKYEICFLVGIINYILDKENLKINKRNPINSEDVITLFSQYAETPDTLKEYLHRICK